MSRGFYALTSGMLTQQRKIDITSNNISNLYTPGYKKEQAITSNFANLMINKVQQRGIHKDEEQIDNVSVIRTVEENNTVYTQGSFDETGSITDFAIAGQGFFRIDNNGDPVYTRNGSFNIDNEGYLTLSHVGRVQGEYGDIFIGTDKYTVNDSGDIIVDDEVLDRVAVYDFNDYDGLRKTGEGMFTSQEEPELVEYPRVLNKTLERSNVDMTKEMTDIISSQRALQTASQAIKIYDMIQDKAASEIGKVN